MLKSRRGRQKFSLDTWLSGVLGKKAGMNAEALVSNIFHHEGHEAHEGIMERIA